MLRADRGEQVEHAKLQPPFADDARWKVRLTARGDIAFVIAHQRGKVLQGADPSNVRPRPGSRQFRPAQITVNRSARPAFAPGLPVRVHHPPKRNTHAAAPWLSARTTRASPHYDRYPTRCRR